ncbi:MAG: N-acetylglucosamine-6-phosphate deacetylase [Pirellulaceae bacterium]
MNTMLIGNRYDTGESVKVAITDGTISGIQSCAESDPTLAMIAPGFVDLQINGYGGQEFNDLELSVDDVRRVSVQMDADGVTNYLPTLTSQSYEMMHHAFSVMHEALCTDVDVQRRVVGFHMEGPYMSAEDGPRGAHPVQHMRPPQWDEFCRLQEAAGGNIRILTMSPEYDGSADFISKATNSGVLVSIGHTSANSDQIKAAVDAGARMSTHLGNGAHRQIRRHPNYLWDQLADDRLVASLIVDGHHLPAEVVKVFMRCKGVDGAVLVSDITGMAGMPPGLYENNSIGGVEVLEDGRLVVPGQRQLLAGASLPIGVGIAKIMEYAGLSLKDAVEMASTRPAALIDIECGALQIGAPADLCMFTLHDGILEVQSTINGGEIVFQR